MKTKIAISKIQAYFFRLKNSKAINEIISLNTENIKIGSQIYDTSNKVPTIELRAKLKTNFAKIDVLEAGLNYPENYELSFEKLF